MVLGLGEKGAEPPCKAMTPGLPALFTSPTDTVQRRGYLLRHPEKGKADVPVVLVAVWERKALLPPAARTHSSIFPHPHAYPRHTGIPETAITSALVVCSSSKDPFTAKRGPHSLSQLLRTLPKRMDDGPATLRSPQELCRAAGVPCTGRAK